MSYSSLREELLAIKANLDTERTSFISHWKELSNNILPRRSQFTISDVNKGDKRNQTIKDETPTLAARTLRAGLMGGITSPARNWFKLTLTNPAMMQIPSVKVWLHEVTRLMNAVFVKSNLYHALPIIYGDIGVFGTASLSIEEDFDDVVRFYSFPIGTYSIAQNSKLQVNVFAREFRLSVRQLVDKFGEKDVNGNIDWSNISDQTKLLWENTTGNGTNSSREDWIDILHVVKPNDKWNPDKIGSFKYDSIYIELSSETDGSRAGADDDTYLRRGGFDYFPVLCPRWEITGEDVYGTNCPGMESLPSIKQLHKMELRSIQAVEKMINPPMIGPLGLRTNKVSTLPGDISYFDERQGLQGLRPVYEVDYNLKDHEFKQEAVRQRIKRSFFEDLFLMFAQMADRDRVTATEIVARKEEKLLVLGPVLERLNQDLLDPLIGTTFGIMAKRGLIPPPPEEIAGAGMKVEYISIMHQAQKSAGLAGVDRLKAHAMEMAQLGPQALDKFDIDGITDEYAEILGTSPKLIRSAEEVEQIRTARAEAEAQREQQMQQLEEADVAANAVKALGSAGG